jgi:serine phosphatase RsbU (regulator of sigma subunit)
VLNNKNQSIQALPTNTMTNTQQLITPQAIQSHSQQMMVPLEPSATSILVMQQYQQIIRDQDVKLAEQHRHNELLTQTCTQLQERCQQLSDQFAVLKAAKAAAAPSSSSSIQEELMQQQQNLLAERVKMQAKLNELEVKVNLLEEK